MLRSSEWEKSLDLEARTSDRPFHRRGAEARRGGAEKRESRARVFLCAASACSASLRWTTTWWPAVCEST